MQENGAASPAHAWMPVPVQHETDIVESIVAHQFFVAGGEGQVDRAIVGGMGRVVAPAILCSYDCQIPANAAERQAVAAVPTTENVQRPGRRGAVAFPLESGNPGSAEHTGEDLAGDVEQAAMSQSSGRSPDGPVSMFAFIAALITVNGGFQGRIPTLFRDFGRMIINMVHVA